MEEALDLSSDRILNDDDLMFLHARNEEVLLRINEQRNILREI